MWLLIRAGLWLTRISKSCPWCTMGFIVCNHLFHYNGVITGAMASQITSFTIVYSTVYSGTDQRKYQSFASLAFVGGIHRWPVNSLHKGPVTRKMFPFDDVIMLIISSCVQWTAAKVKCNYILVYGYEPLALMAFGTKHVSNWIVFNVLFVAQK